MAVAKLHNSNGCKELLKWEIPGRISKRLTSPIPYFLKTCFYTVLRQKHRHKCTMESNQNKPGQGSCPEQARPFGVKVTLQGKTAETQSPGLVKSLQMLYRHPRQGSSTAVGNQSNRIQKEMQVRPHLTYSSLFLWAVFSRSTFHRVARREKSSGWSWGSCTFSKSFRMRSRSLERRQQRPHQASTMLLLPRLQ